MNFDIILEISYFILGSAGVGYFTFQVIKSILPDPELLAAQQRLGVESAARQYKHSSLRILAPFYKLFVPRIQQIKMPLYRQKKRSDFIAAGVADQFDPDEFVGLKVIAAVLTLVFGTILLVQMNKSPGLGMTTLLLLVGFFIPDYVIWDLKRKRQKAILSQLPNVMDLLTLSVEAGLDFMAAISRVVYFAKDGPLKEEFNQMLKELQLGTVRADGLRNMADRVQVTELSSFATILIQADQMGSSIGPVLRAQSDQLRAARFQRAEREGAKAAQKLLIPLVCCILPSVFIVIFGPYVCDILYNQTWFRDVFSGGGH